MFTSSISVCKILVIKYEFSSVRKVEFMNKIIMKFSIIINFVKEKPF